MIPVLAVTDPIAAHRHLTTLLGLTAEDGEILRFGEQVIRLCQVGSPPPELIPMRLDHLALRVGDADRIYRSLSARGAQLSPEFTPTGPREIAEFWQRGVRYVFFDGPERWPIEFCARIGQPRASDGHDHLAIRHADLDRAEAALAKLGAKRIARHLLEGPDSTVEVRFLSLGATVFELFDEAPISPTAGAGGWIGVLAD